MKINTQKCMHNISVGGSSRQYKWPNWNIYQEHVVHVGLKNMNSQHVNCQRTQEVQCSCQRYLYNFHEKDLYLTHRFTSHSTGSHTVKHIDTKLTSLGNMGRRVDICVFITPWPEHNHISDAPYLHEPYDHREAQV